MPWPEECLTLYGGCNCRAVRYRVLVPRYEDRPRTPYCTPGAEVDQTARIPAVYMDHCNDCRRATSAFLPAWLVTESQTVQVSCLTPELIPASGKEDSDDALREWKPIGDVARDDAGSVVNGTSLGHYVSSKGRNRWFCRHCGTPLVYNAWDDAVPKEWGWPTMVDICLGTVDREYPIQEYMQPERQLWCQRAIPWIKEVSISGVRRPDGIEVPRHPLTKIDKLDGDDVHHDQKNSELAGVAERAEA